MTGTVVALLLLYRPVRAEDETFEAAKSAKRLLVLTSGRIVEGKISKSAGGFVVDKPRGSMLIPYEQVKFEATTRQEAYAKLRDQLPMGLATGHVALARWCLTYQMFDECRSELREALKIDPDRRDARSMLRKLEEILNPGKPVHLDLPKPALRTSDGFQSQQATSLAGLPRETAREFLGRIQPILLNRCGNASCHGPAAVNEFRLVNVRIGRGSHRVFSERNLAMILQQVDFEKPENSPLLRALNADHGRRGRSIFYGPRSSGQIAALRGWVRRVAREGLPGRPLDPERSAAASARPGAQSETFIQGRKPKPPRETETKSHETKDDLLEAVLRDERKDAFDPEIFNRKVHGKKRARTNGLNSTSGG